MPIIDKEGKLFKKINLLDFLILVCVVLAVLMAGYVYYQSFSQKKAAEIGLEEKLLDSLPVDIMLVDLDKSFLAKIKKGLVTTDFAGNKLVEITDTFGYSPYVKLIDVGDGKKIPIIKENKYQIKTKMIIYGWIKDDNFYYQDEQVKLSKMISFYYAGKTLQGYPVHFINPDPKKNILTPAEFIIYMVNVPGEVKDRLGPEDLFYDKGGELSLEIKEIRNISNKKVINLGDDHWQSLGRDDSNQIQAKVIFWGEVKNDNFYFNDQLIKFGKSFTVKLYNQEIIAYLAEDENNYTNVLVKLRVSQAKDYFINLIKSGDEVKAAESGEFARVMSVVMLGNSAEWHFKDDGLIKVYHPEKFDLEITMLVHCLDIKGDLFFKDQPVKIRSNFIFGPPKYSITGTIINIEELKKRKED